MKSFHAVMNIPSPYRLHLFREMARQLSEKGVELHVHFMSDMSRGHDARPLSWRNPVIDFPHTYWKDYGVKNYHFNPGLIRYLRHKRPDVLLVGCPFDTFTSILIAWCCPAPIRCTWSEGNTKTPGKMTGFKGWLKRAVFSKYRYVAVPGSDGGKYFALLQAHTDRKMPHPILLPNLIDESRFKPRASWLEKEIVDVRTWLGVQADERFALTPARLDHSKGLLEYLGRLTPRMLQGWRIVIFGQGELKAELEALIRRQGIADRVTIHAYVPYDEMPKVYAAADMFVLPSNLDPNPLSVIEALNSGLPVAVSEMAGNVEEAVTNGVNGWVLPIKDDERYSKILAEVFSTNMDRLRVMGAYSKDMNAQFWNTQTSVASFLKGLGL